MIKVFNTSDEPKMFLSLVQEGSRACLILVDKNGDNVDAGHILTISKEGVTFHSGINKDAPFEMTSDREICNCDS